MRYGIVIATLLLLSINGYSQKWNTTKFKEIEDKIAIEVLKYRNTNGDADVCYRSEYNQFVREWSIEFVNKRNTHGEFVLDDNDTLSPHFNSMNRCGRTNKVGLTTFAKSIEIAAFSAYPQNISEEFEKECIKGFDLSVEHNKILNSNRYTNFSIGFFYNEKSRRYAVYILFFLEYVKNPNGEWVIK